MSLSTISAGPPSAARMRSGCIGIARNRRFSKLAPPIGSVGLRSMPTTLPCTPVRAATAIWVRPAGGAAEIDDAPAGSEQPKALVELQ